MFILLNKLYKINKNNPDPDPIKNIARKEEKYNTAPTSIIGNIEINSTEVIEALPP
jgi:hypothetical protein